MKEFLAQFISVIITLLTPLLYSFVIVSIFLLLYFTIWAIRYVAANRITTENPKILKKRNVQTARRLATQYENANNMLIILIQSMGTLFTCSFLSTAFFIALKCIRLIIAILFIDIALQEKVFALSAYMLSSLFLIFLEPLIKKIGIHLLKPGKKAAKKEKNEHTTAVLNNSMYVHILKMPKNIKGIIHVFYTILFIIINIHTLLANSSRQWLILVYMGMGTYYAYDRMQSFYQRKKKKPENPFYDPDSEKACQEETERVHAYLQNFVMSYEPKAEDEESYSK